MTELVQISPKEYGLEESRATEIAKAFQPSLQAMIELEQEYSDFSNLVGDPPQETCEKAKALRLRYVKIRTGTAAIHKEEKAVYLNAGCYVDAWKNRQLEISKEREDKLDEIENHYINIEKARIKKLDEERTAEAQKYLLDFMPVPEKLGELHADVWERYISGLKAQYEARIEAERKAEEERLAKEKAEREEQERIRKENEKLRKEAEAREKQIQEERRIQEEKLAAERKERERIESEKQAEIEKERQERERLEKAEKARLAEEQRIRAEKELAEKKAAAAPDKEKLKSFLLSLLEIDFPSVSTDEAKKTVIDLEIQFQVYVHSSLTRIANL